VVTAFARRYLHAGMVRLNGEKMSKSRGNLVFVGSLVADGTDPMAIRLAILAHHYRHDWDWTADGLAAAAGRLARWRSAVSRALASPEVPPGAPGSGPGSALGGGPGGASVGGPAGGPAAGDALAAIRERLADDLDAPGAVAAADGWARAILAAPAMPPGARESALLLRDGLDALLGIAL
jgi:L-cysteine:1D-myo-inositol 2-amino-2-deoxy-alpha-D-glucopyranoside ligase